MTDANNSNTRLRWEPKISLGSVLQIAVLLVSVTAAYFTLDKEIALERQARQSLKLLFDQRLSNIEQILRTIKRQEAKADRKPLKRL